MITVMFILSELKSLEVIFYLALIIAIIVVLITSASCYLQYYGLKISKEKEESEEQKLEKREKRMYYSNMILLILTTILIYTYKSSLAVIPIFLIGFSIIARAMKNKKVSNILCWVIVIPMLIVPFLSPLYIPSFDRSCAFDFEIGAFNSKFTQYEGNNKNKALVKSLIINVVSSNEKPENKNRKVAIIFNGEEQNDLEGINSKLTSNKYKISVERGDDEYVKKVIIEENIDSTNITNDVKENVITEK